MAIVDIQQAKTQFSKLVEATASGEEVIIAKAGKPMVRLIPVSSPRVERKIGGMEGKIWIADDFDGPLPEEIQRAFEGR
ncbi:type II toxin-antitoxin system Phd/YefM family antitoxin [Duganella sp. PWIR1]